MKKEKNIEKEIKKEIILRNHTQWESRNKFYCKGRIQTGPASYAVFLTCITILIPYSCFLAFPIVVQTTLSLLIIKTLIVLLYIVISILQTNQSSVLLSQFSFLVQHFLLYLQQLLLTQE
jgi:hypothetical protein